jgi:threonine dehydratase
VANWGPGTQTAAGKQLAALATKQISTPTVAAIEAAASLLTDIVEHTPLVFNRNLSERYGANVSLKREDLQVVRSYKIRGAYNRIAAIDQADRANGVVCASAGNHGQGVAYACNKLDIHGTVFMPTPTPGQKINQLQGFGGNKIDVVLVGDTFDDAYAEALKFCERSAATFIHPFNDPLVIAGQGTVGLEILQDIEAPIDYLILPIGGGGLASGIATYFKQHSPGTKIIGVEPEGAAAMKASIDAGELVTLSHIDKFVDGAAVKAPGELTWQICRDSLGRVMDVPEGQVCTTLLKMYNEEAIIAEPAGVLSISALEFLKDEIKGKNVVSVISGGNNDIVRMEEIKERSLLYEGLLHYFIISFPQRAGALREFLVDVLGPNDDITHFQYSKKNSRERGPAVIGIELKYKKDYTGLRQRLDKVNFKYEYLNENPELFHHLI